MLPARPLPAVCLPPLSRLATSSSLYSSLPPFPSWLPTPRQQIFLMCPTVCTLPQYCSALTLWHVIRHQPMDKHLTGTTKHLLVPPQPIARDVTTSPRHCFVFLRSACMRGSVAFLPGEGPGLTLSSVCLQPNAQLITVANGISSCGFFSFPVNLNNYQKIAKAMDFLGRRNILT